MEWAIKMFGPTLLCQNEKLKESTLDALADSKYVILYVSAGFCPPCRKVTPVLAVMYEELTKHCESQTRPMDIAVVFASADHNPEEFEDYYGHHMPWHAVPYECEQREAILDAYRDQGIPRLVIFESATGKVLDADARKRLMGKRSLIDFLVDQ